MKVKIDKISNNPHSYDSDLPLEGRLLCPPEEGYSVTVIGGDHGGFITSAIQKIMKTDKGWTIKTRNSIYSIEIIDIKELK